MRFELVEHGLVVQLYRHIEVETATSLGDDGDVGEGERTLQWRLHCSLRSSTAVASSVHDGLAYSGALAELPYHPLA